MNKLELIRLANECGIGDPDLSDDKTVVTDYGNSTAEVLRFAEAVMSVEREACAELCEQWNATPGERLAAAIRARGSVAA